MSFRVSIGDRRGPQRATGERRHRRVLLARDDVRGGDDEPRRDDPAAPLDAEPTGRPQHAHDRRSRAPDARLPQDARVERPRRNRRPGQALERVDSPERVQDRPRRHDLVQTLEHDRLLHRAPQLRLARKLERHRAKHPHRDQADERASQHPERRVDGAQAPALAAADGSSKRASDDLEEHGEGDRADDREHRRVRRARAAGQEHGREPPADDRAHDETRQREPAPHEALRRASEGGYHDERDQEPVNESHSS